MPRINRERAYTIAVPEPESEEENYSVPYGKEEISLSSPRPSANPSSSQELDPVRVKRDDSATSPTTRKASRLQCFICCGSCRDKTLSEEEEQELQKLTKETIKKHKDKTDLKKLKYEDDTNTLFRNENECSKLCRKLFDKYCPNLPKTLLSIIKGSLSKKKGWPEDLLIDQNLILNLDLEWSEDKERVQENRDRFEEAAINCLRKVIKKPLPAPVQVLLKTRREISEKNFPGIGRRLAASLLFLRLLGGPMTALVIKKYPSKEKPVEQSVLFSFLKMINQLASSLDCPERKEIDPTLDAAATNVNIANSIWSEIGDEFIAFIDANST